MATRIVTHLVDDVDPADEANQTVTFALDGTAYEIDLTDERAEKLRSSVLEWSEFARVTSSRVTVTTRTRNRRSAHTDYDPVKVREWAKEQGIELSQRGRLSAEVITAYKASH